MNETKTENTDRFWLPKGMSEECKEKQCEEKYEKHMMLEYAPEPHHMNETKIKKLKFTVGNKYPVIQENKNNLYCMYQFKTIDDNGEENWVDGKYFNLDEKLKWDVELIDWDSPLPDVRRVAAEKQIKPLEVINDGMKDETIILSGLKEEAPKSEQSWQLRSIHEGLVKDTGNALMENASLCALAIDKVFGNKEIDQSPSKVDVGWSKQEITEAININFNRSIGVDIFSFSRFLGGDPNDYLCAGNIKTNITYESIQSAYSGLKGLVSAKTAKTIVAKMLVKKLKKVF